MNRAVVRMATAALVAWLERNVPGARDSGVVVGGDARHGTAEFVDEVTRVLVGAGFVVHLLGLEQPTPLVAFAVRELHAAAGVMITASHNPAADNGYKLYLRDGVQIAPPVDTEIEALMAGIGRLSSVPIGDETGALVSSPGPVLEAAYLAALCRVSSAPLAAESGSPGDALRIVYTPLHGVAAGLLLRALEHAGFPAPIVVAAQARPDPAFPTVAFPNPEDPGALELALEEARRSDADVVLANDPDGDRFAAAVPDSSASGGFRVLSGDQIGVLLGAYVLGRTAHESDPGERLVVTTIVSSSMLRRIAEAAGVRYAETLTGFKWISRAGQGSPGGHTRSRLVFGYEEALGYSIGTVVLDKDGIGAALAWLGLVTEARSHGAAVLDLLDDLEERHGVHLTSQVSFPSARPAAAMSRLRERPLAELAGHAVVSTSDLSRAPGQRGDPAYDGLPASDVLVYRTSSARVIVRPSGTEAKLKIYFEVVRPVPDRPQLERARSSASAELAEVTAAATGAIERALREPGTLGTEN